MVLLKKYEAFKRTYKGHAAYTLKISIMTLKQYKKLDAHESYLLLSRHGIMLDEVTVYGMLRLRLYSLHNFYVQVVFNKHDHKLLEVKPLQYDDDWSSYVESKDLKSFY